MHGQDQVQLTCGPSGAGWGLSLGCGKVLSDLRVPGRCKMGCFCPVTVLLLPGDQMPPLQELGEGPSVAELSEPGQVRSKESHTSDAVPFETRAFAFGTVLSWSQCP